MSKLPSQVPSRLRNIAHIVSAYGICLKLEKDIQEDIDTMKNVGRSMIYCRILGYLIHYAPTDQALKTVVHEIFSCEQRRESLLRVGQMYYDHYIRAFRSNKGRTPTPPNHASRPSFDKLSDMIKDMLEEAPQSHASAKRKALVRDRFRCPISGFIDYNSMEQNGELEEMAIKEGLQRRFTECAHILSESINLGISKGSDKERYASSVWAILQRFGYTELPKELNGSSVHRLENVITMELNVHTLFDNLTIWLTPTDEVNTYKLEARKPMDISSYPKYVTFTTPDEKNLSVPNPAYLALHAACAKVTHLSGAAEYIDKVFRDMEDITVLSADGASAEILEHAILCASPRPILA